YSFSNQMKLLGAGLTAARSASKAYKEVDKLQKEAQSRTSATQPLEQGQQQQQQQQQQDHGDNDATGGLDAEGYQKASEKIEASLPAFLELAWAVNVQDITRTLKGVCKRLFHDAAELVPLEVRLKRAAAMKVLGREFYTMGQLAKSTQVHKPVDAAEIRARAEVAAMTTMAKAQGQELNDGEAEMMIRQARERESVMKQQQAAAAAAAAQGK
ncbi:MAG: hypothetical protein ACRDL7_08655, partial [Gaiellaceae bacterium]